MSQRFFCTSFDEPKKSAFLEGSEANHLSQVMRKRVGDEVTLFDGSGSEFKAQVARIERRKVTFDVLERTEVNRELDRPIWIAAALPKGDRQSFMIQKLVELGVTRFVPLMVQRSVAKFSASVESRIQKQVIEASKQCERNVLMSISEGTDLAGLQEQTGDYLHCVMCHPYGTSETLQSRQARCFVIGPEGGFTDQEFEFAKQHDWELVSLGARILRTETAAVAVAAAAVLNF